MEHLEQYKVKIEEAIESLGIDPKVCRSDLPNKWLMHRGQAQVVLMVRESSTYKNETRNALVMVSPIVILPQEEPKRQTLLQFLLSTSHQMITEGFSIAKEPNGTEVAYLSATYFIDYMDTEEVAFMLDSLSFYAYKFSEELRAEFMGQKESTEELPPFNLDE